MEQREELSEEYRLLRVERSCVAWSMASVWAEMGDEAAQ